MELLEEQPNFGIQNQQSPVSSPLRVEEVEEITLVNDNNSDTSRSRDIENLETFGPLRSVSQSGVKNDTKSDEEDDEDIVPVNVED